MTKLTEADIDRIVTEAFKAVFKKTGGKLK